MTDYRVATTKLFTIDINDDAHYTITQLPNSFFDVPKSKILDLESSNLFGLMLARIKAEQYDVEENDRHINYICAGQFV